MRGVVVDPQSQTVRVQGGATLADIDRETPRIWPGGTDRHGLPDRYRRPHAWRRRWMAGT